MDKDVIAELGARAAELEKRGVGFADAIRAGWNRWAARAGAAAAQGAAHAGAAAAQGAAHAGAAAAQGAAHAGTAAGPSFWSRMFTRPVTVPHVTPGGHVLNVDAGRQLSPGRIAAGVGAGAVGLGHAQNAIRDSLTQDDPASQYLQAQAKYRAGLQSQQAQLSQARGLEADGGPSWFQKHLDPKYRSPDQIQRDMVSGNFSLEDGFGPRLGGLNPWASNTGQDVLRRAGAGASAMKSKYEDAAGVAGADPHTIQSQIDDLGQQASQAVLPEQRQVFEQQMSQLRHKLSDPYGAQSPAARQIRFRMMALGMPDPMRQGGQQPGGYGGGGLGYGPSSGVGPYAPPGGFGVPGYQPDPYELNDRVRRFALDPENYRARPGIGNM